MELGARIAHYRSQAGLNQSELARAMKPAVTPQTVQAWEKGGGIRPSKFESLASALGISLGTLLLGDDYADPSQPVRIDPATLAEALKLVDYDEDLGGEYEPQERARQVISAYEEIHAHGGTASHAYIGKVTLAAEARRGQKTGEQTDGRSEKAGKR